MRNFDALFLKRLTVKTILHRNRNGFHSWVSRPCEPYEAAIIGKRTLQQGSVEYIEDAGNVFTRDPKKDIQALVVVEGMKRNPIYISLHEYEDQISSNGEKS